MDVQCASEIFRFFYISRAKIDPWGPELLRILESSLALNGRRNITGVLYFSGEHFAQILEGPHAALAALMQRIERDRRHQILMRWPVAPAQEPRGYPSLSLCYVLDGRLESMLEVLLQEDQQADFTELGRSLSTGTMAFRREP